jgi:transcriptional regulator with XRE-family HTH domain/tetratricopeptide (TPR) repeat protein
MIEDTEGIREEDRKPNYLLRRAREERGWSQKQLALEIHARYPGVAVTGKEVGRWERGTRVPGSYYREKLCAVLEKSASELGFIPPDEPGKENSIHQEQHNWSLIQSAPTGNQVILLTPEQAAALNSLLGLGENNMDTVGISKRNALAKLFQAQNKNTSTVTEQPMQLSAALSRRSAIATIIGTAAAALGLSQDIGYPQLHPQEALLLCASNIPLCWSLYFEGGLAETKEHITSYIRQLSSLASYPSAYQKQAAGLASQAYQLSALIEILFHNMGIALDHAKRAIEFAALTGDFNLQTAAQIRLAVVYSNLNRPQQRLVAYQQALQCCEPTSPLLQARVYAGLTEAHSALGDEKSALHYLELTNNIVPAQYETDPNFSYTHFDPWSIQMYEKDMWIDLGKPENAWQTLERAHRVVEQGLTVNRVDLTVKQAETSVLLGNLESGRDYLMKAIDGAAALGSQLLMDNVHDIYLTMKRRWPHEQSVLQLEERLQIV